MSAYRGYVLPPPTPTPPPPDGWPSWRAYRLYLTDPDGGATPYRMPDPHTPRTYLDAASETS